MKRNNIFTILNMLSLFLILTSFVSSSQAKVGATEITINVVVGELKFDPEKVNLEKNTEYNITFKNTDSVVPHNLLIDVDKDVSESNLDDSADKQLGPNNDAIADNTTVWSILWTTPNEDVDIPYFCGFSGHFASGMKGKFVIGEGSPAAPGFEFFILIFGIFSIALIRKRK